MAEKKLRSAMGSLNDLDALAAKYKARSMADAESYRRELAERTRLYGTEVCRTSEQEAAWKEFMANSKLDVREIHTEEDWTNFLIEMFVDAHGCVSAFGFLHPDVDWEHIRDMAIERGHHV